MVNGADEVVLDFCVDGVSALVWLSVGREVGFLCLRPCALCLWIQC